MSAAPTPNWLSPTAGSTGGTNVRLRRVLLGGTGLFAVVAALTYAVLWLKPPTAAKVFLWSARYADTVLIPPNELGFAGVERVQETARTGKSGAFFAESQSYRLTRGDFTRQLADLSDFRGSSIVLVFAAHGGTDGQGAYLLPDDAGPEPQDRIRLDPLFDALARLPKKCHKLVVFESAVAPAIPAIGQFTNDFYRGLSTWNDRIETIPNLVVLASAGANQRAWPAVEQGTTAFLHFLNRAMRGEADRNGDGRLTAAEVIDFTTSQTRDWVKDQHTALQVPVLFPQGESGRNRADLNALSIVIGALPPDPLPSKFEPPAEWASAWKDYRTLAAQDPHPVTSAPELWREYTQWLLRYDELTRTDAPAADALQTANRLRKEILSRIVIATPPQTLRLPFALGEASRPDEQVRPALDALAVLPEADLAKALAETLKNLGGDTTANRLLLCRAAIQRLADDPLPRLRVIQNLLLALTESLPIKPAEVHFANRLAADLPPALLAERAGSVLQRVLRLRLLAKECAAERRGEMLCPWITEEIDRADRARSRAEDELFLGNDRAWEQAAISCDEAETAYNRARVTAATVRAAETTWQVSVIELSDLSEWLADGPRAAGLPDRAKAEKLLLNAQNTWLNVHELGRLLETPNPKVLEELSKQTESVRQAVRGLREAHRSAVEGLLARRERQESRRELIRWWLEAESVLSVPGGEQRRALAVEARRVSRQLVVTAATTPEPLELPLPAVARETAFDHARRRAQLYLARVQEPKGGLPPLAFRFEEFARLADADEVLTTASDRLAIRFADVARQSSSSSSDERSLVLADQFARVSVWSTKANACEKLRTLRATDFLEWQARRTEADFWAGNDGSTTPYFQRAAKVLRAEVERKRVPGQTNAAPDGWPFAVKHPATRIVTDEPNPQVAFELTPTNLLSARPGVVAYWNSTSPAQRWPQETGKRPAAPIKLPVPPRIGELPTAPVLERGAVTLTGYFRGRKLEQSVFVERHPVPHMTAVHRPLGDSASIAVRADQSLRDKYGVGRGSLHFVVDATGSMGPDPETPGDKGRYPLACEALERILKDLPVGVKVTVSVFGHRSATGYEDSFETILPPTVWTTKAESQASEVLKAVRVLQPWDESPVVRAVFRAKQSLAGKDGATAVIMIGDAVDTKFRSDELANPKKITAKEAIRAAFSTEATALHVVAIPVTDKAEQTAQDEFRVVKECKPPGLFITPDATAELVSWIRNATGARIRVSLSGEREKRELLNGSDESDNWLTPTVKPGQYTAQTTLAAPVEQHLDMQPGERLVLSLSDDLARPRFLRPNALQSSRAIGRATVGGWSAAALRQRLTDAGGLELTFAVDRAGSAADLLSPTRVSDSWFELAPAIERPLAVRWVREPGWPAPTWKLSTRSWPNTGTPSPAKLSAWWSETAFAPALAWKPKPGTTLLDTRNEAVGNSIIESITREGHEVEVRPDRIERRSCLVVRLAFPQADTVLARPQGSQPTGSEMRVYRDAGRASCLFWWDSDTGMSSVTGFELISISQAKAAATTATLPTLPAPTPGVLLPSPAPRD